MGRAAQRDWERSSHPAMTYRPPQALRRTRMVLSIFLSTALVVGVWAVLWYGALVWVRVQARNWVAAQLTNGAVAAYDDVEVSGSPTRIVVRFLKPHYGATIFAERFDLRGDVLVLSARLWTPWRLRVEVQGRLDIRMDSQKLKFSGRAKDLVATFTPGREGLENLVLTIRKLRMDGSSPVAMESLSLRSVREDQTLILAATGRGWTLPLNGGWGLGDTIDSFDARLHITGPLNTRGTLTARLAAWRDGGGAVQVNRLQVRTGPFALNASGTVTLDQDFQPLGAFTAKMRGLFSVLEILRTEGLIRGPDAVLATMALAAFSTRPKDGGAASISLPVTVQNGNLSLGPVSVAKVPRINWGGENIKPKKALPRDYKDVPPVF